MVVSFVAVSAPQFVVGILLLYVFAVNLGWFPIGGYGTFAHLVLPSLTLGILGAGWYARMMRSSMIDVLRQDYMRTAQGQGPETGDRDRRPRAAQRHPADRRHDRHRHRHLHERHRGGRERLRLAGHRPARLAGDPADRHSDHHGGDAGLGLRHHHRQSHRGPDRTADRSAHQDCGDGCSRSFRGSNQRESSMRKTHACRPPPAYGARRLRDRPSPRARSSSPTRTTSPRSTRPSATTGRTGRSSRACSTG